MPTLSARSVIKEREAARAERKWWLTLGRTALVDLGRRLRDHLETVAVSIPDFARDAGVHPSRIWWIQSGAGNTTIRSLVPVYKALGLDLELVPRWEATVRPEVRTRGLNRKRKVFRASNYQRSQRRRMRKDRAIAIAAAELRRLGRRLRGRRLALGLSSDELADAAGVMRLQVSKLEGGLGNPTIATIARIADALGWGLKWRERPHN